MFRFIKMFIGLWSTCTKSALSSGGSLASDHLVAKSERHIKCNL